MYGEASCHACLSGYVPFSDEDGLFIGCQPDPVAIVLIVLAIIIFMCFLFTYCSNRYRIYLQKQANIEFTDEMTKLSSNPDIVARFRSSSLFTTNRSFRRNSPSTGSTDKSHQSIELGAVGMKMIGDEAIKQEWEKLETQIYEAKTSGQLVETFESMLQLVIKEPRLAVEKEELLSIASSKRVSLLRDDDGEEDLDVWNVDVAKAFGKVLSKMKQ